MGNTSTKSIKLNRTLENFIGTGSFGTVYKAKYGDKTVAVKVINLHSIKHSPNYEKYRDVDKNELVPFIKQLSHENVASILAWEDKYPEYWIAIEYCDCTLEQYIERHYLNVAQTSNLLWQGARGMEYLHHNNITHRDVKPDNFLIVEHCGLTTVKVTDFSLCKDKGDKLSNSIMTTVRGNKYWLAPELLSEDGHCASIAQYKRSIDVFSFGLVIIYVCINVTDREKFRCVCMGSLVKTGVDISSYFRECWRSDGLKEQFVPLIDKMLELDPEKRPSMSDVKNSIQICPQKPRDEPLETSPLDGYSKGLYEIGSARSELEYRAGAGSVSGGSSELKTSRTQQHFIITTKVKLVNVGSYTTVCKDSCNISIASDKNFVLIQDPYTLTLLEFREFQNQYNKVWREYQSYHSWNRGLLMFDNKIITWSHNKAKCEIKCRDVDFNLLYKHRVSYSGNLVSVLPHLMVFNDNGMGTLAKFDEHRYTIGEEIYVRPLDPIFSVCQDPILRWIAVCDMYETTLEILNDRGDLQFKTQLQYRPARDNAIACNSSYIVVIDYSYTVLHIHNWRGDEITEKYLEDLPLGSSIRQISLTIDNILHVATSERGGRDFIHLHTLRIQTV